MTMEVLFNFLLFYNVPEITYPYDLYMNIFNLWNIVLWMFVHCSPISALHKKHNFSGQLLYKDIG